MMRDASKHDKANKDIRIDTATHMVTGPKGSAHLTPREFELMECLKANEGKPVSRTELLEDAWGWEHADDLKTKTVEMHIVRLRHKLSSAGLNPSSIETIRGKGYRLNASA